MTGQKNTTAEGDGPNGGREQGRGNVLPSYYTIKNWYRSIDWTATIRHFPHNLRRLVRIRWDEWQLRDVRRDEELHGPPDCWPPAVPTSWQQAAHEAGARYWWDCRTQADLDAWLADGGP